MFKWDSKRTKIVYAFKCNIIFHDLSVAWHVWTKKTYHNVLRVLERRRKRRNEESEIMCQMEGCYNLAHQTARHSHSPWTPASISYQTLSRTPTVQRINSDLNAYENPLRTPTPLVSNVYLIKRFTQRTLYTPNALALETYIPCELRIKRFIHMMRHSRGATYTQPSTHQFLHTPNDLASPVLAPESESSKISAKRVGHVASVACFLVLI